MSKLTIGDTFKIDPIELRIVSIDSFGTTHHYGVTFKNEKGDYHSGWVPVEFVDNLAKRHPTLQEFHFEIPGKFCRIVEADNAQEAIKRFGGKAINSCPGWALVVRNDVEYQMTWGPAVKSKLPPRPVCPRCLTTGLDADGNCMQCGLPAKLL